MEANVMPITHSAAWQELTARREELSTRHLRELFAEDPDRFARLSLSVDGLLADFSKQRIDARTGVEDGFQARLRAKKTGIGLPDQRIVGGSALRRPDVDLCFGQGGGQLSRPGFGLHARRKGAGDAGFAHGSMKVE